MESPAGSTGAALSNKLVRAGRSMQSGVFFITQSSSDLLDEKIKNNIGLKFAFHSTDKTEIRNTLRFFGLDPDDEENQNAIMALETGECLMQGHLRSCWKSTYTDLYHACI